MNIGLILPQFRYDFREALHVANEAEEVGIDGLFAFEHLWPPGEPQRPCLEPFVLLGAVAEVTKKIAVGTLVARVGLTSNEVLVSRFRSLAHIAPSRVIAGLGIGDRQSIGENSMLGIELCPGWQRRQQLASVCATLMSASIPVWVGGKGRKTIEIARKTGAAVNLWDVTPAVIKEESTKGEVTWGGVAPSDYNNLLELLTALAGSGASWAIVGWPRSVIELGNAASEIHQIS